MDWALTVCGLGKGWGGPQPGMRWAKGMGPVETEAEGGWGQKLEEKARCFIAHRWWSQGRE